METSETLVQVETSMNTHLKAKGNLVQVGQSTMPTKRHCCAQKNPFVREEKHQILTSEFGQQNSCDKFPSLNVIQTGSKN